LPEAPDGGRPGISDKVWAVLGLAAALVLAGISIDLLLGSRPGTAAGGDGSDDGCGC
jgi:hypothetical protein